MCTHLFKFLHRCAAILHKDCDIPKYVLPVPPNGVVFALRFRLQSLLYIMLPTVPRSVRPPFFDAPNHVAEQCSGYSSADSWLMLHYTPALYSGKSIYHLLFLMIRMRCATRKPDNAPLPVIAGAMLSRLFPLPYVHFRKDVE